MANFPALSVGPWTLRPLEHDDAAPWHTLLQDPELRRLTSWNIQSLAEMQNLVADYTDGPRAQTTRRWAIVDVDGAFCGTCGFKDWDKSTGTAEITYELAAAQRQRGAMSAIASAVIDSGGAHMGLRLIKALVNVDNDASNRLLAKLGFTRTARLPALRSCNGVVCDFFSCERAVGG